MSSPESGAAQDRKRDLRRSADARRLPRDYKRDARGRVSTHEFNRYLPMIRCADCGTWVQAGAEHTVRDCDVLRRVER